MREPVPPHASGASAGAGRRATVLIATLLVVSLVTACSRSAPQAQPVDAELFAERVAQSIQAARAEGAGEHQLAILERARDNGQLTFEDALSAILADMDCVVQGGGTVEYNEQLEDSGLVIPAYLVLAADDAGLDEIRPTVEACSTRESFWVNKLYQLQPSSQQVRDEHLASVAPAIRACLEENGYTTEPSATPQELASQAIAVYLETGEEVDCSK